MNSSTTPQINVTRWLIIFCLLHLCLWTIIPTLFRGAIPFDTAEGFAWGSQWQWGYDKHPPLAPWLTALFGQLSGVGFATYLLSQLAVIIAFVCIFQLAKQIMPPIYALISLFLLEGIDFYTLASPKFDPDVLSLATWALAILLFYQAVKSRRIWHWILLGCAAGLAMLTKYTAILLLISMLVVLLTTKEGRQSFKQSGPYVACAMFLLTLLPNLVWLIQHDFISITYAMDRGASHAFVTYPFLNHILHPGLFIFEESSRFLPVIFLILVFYWRRPPQGSRLAPQKLKALDEFDQKFLLILLFTPFIIAITISFLIGTNLHAGWAYPFFTLSTVTLIYFIRPQIKLSAFKQFVGIVIIVGGGLLLTPVLVMQLSPYYKHTTDRALFPMHDLTLAVTQSWEKKYHQPLKYVAGSRYLTAFITAYSTQHPKPYYEWNLKNSPWIDENEMKTAGALFVWWIDDKSNQGLAPEILTRFPHVEEIQIKEFDMLTKASVSHLKIGMAFLPPVSLSLPQKGRERK
jgi:hypothetical protein